MTPDEMTALIHRAHAVRFKLENLTEVMNEMLREFEALLAARFKASASIPMRDTFGRLHFNGSRLVVCMSENTGSYLLNCSREIRTAALGKCAELYSAVEMAQREYDANEGRPA